MARAKSVHDMFLDELTDVCRQESDEVAAATTDDQLAYMADMLRELRDMAESSGFSELSGFIEAARTEALKNKQTA